MYLYDTLDHFRKSKSPTLDSLNERFYDSEMKGVAKIKRYYHLGMAKIRLFYSCDLSVIGLRGFFGLKWKVWQKLKDIAI